MFKLLTKGKLIALLAFSTCVSSSLSAFGYGYDDSCYNCCPTECNRFYVGAFGGGLYSNSPRLTQLGTAFFTEAAGGPLAVIANGHARRTSTGFGGVQIGYEWRQNSSDSFLGLTPGVELEAFFYRHTRKGDLINLTDRLDEHDFRNSFPMNVGVYLINGTLSFNSFGSFTPYLGLGIGPADLSIRKATSTQIAPPEEGINHFNSRRHSSDWAFAAQGKAGLRYNFCEKFHVFAEYRFLYIEPSEYLFGSTSYPTHAPTSPWNVGVGDMWYNAFAIGIQFDL